MGILRLKYSKRLSKDTDEYCLPVSEFNKFNASVLDLGDISKDGKYFEALAAIFDLEGFTSFCNQIDPHLVIPEYLNEFLAWLFRSISEEFVRLKEGDEIILWSHLPFYAKFMGDGVLFLWDTSDFVSEDIGNITISLQNICKEYREQFLPIIRMSVSKPPTKLRCGIARGQIISVGDGKDFVGPCINVASRLQKIGQFSFAFSKRGFNLKKCFSEAYQDDFILIKAPVRGVGEEELIFVLASEYKELTEDEKKQLLP